MANTNTQLIICQLLSKIIMSEFVRILINVRIQTKNEGPKSSLSPYLQAWYTLKEKNQFCLTWLVLSKSVLVPGDHCLLP